MQFPKLPFNSKKSNAHLLLLTYFFNPRNPDELSRKDEWESALEEKLTHAINRFVIDEILEEADLENTISYRFLLTDLKKMSKERGLPVSGRKLELIRRLISADPVMMKKSVAGLKVYQLSSKGVAVADEFMMEEKVKRERAELLTLDYIMKGMFKEASLTRAAFEAKQIFPVGLGIDWNNYSPDRDVDELTIIFNNKPKILAKVNDKDLQILRLAASMVKLWGSTKERKWLPDDFSMDLPFDNETAIRMYVFYASNKENIALYKKYRVTEYVRVFTGRDACDECKKFEGKRYSINNPPELPHENCTHEMGCRCSYMPLDL